MRRVGSGSCRRKRSRHCTESDWNEGEKILYFIFYIVPIHVGGSEEKTFRDISSAMYHLLPGTIFCSSHHTGIDPSRVTLHRAPKKFEKKNRLVRISQASVWID